MTRKMTGLIAAGSLAIGIAVGAAGTTVARDDAAPDMADHMRGMASMMSMMGAGATDGMGSMMGADHMADMASMEPGASMSPDDHASHHASPSPEPTR